MKRLMIFLQTTTILLIMNCSGSIDLEAEKAQVKAVLEQFALALEKEDIAMVDKLFAKDADMVWLGTDATEWLIGWSDIKTAFEQSFAAFEQTSVTVTDQSIKVNAKGSVAWYAEKMSIKVKSQGQNFDVSTRITGVLEKRDGQWLLVQGHTSVSISEQAVKY